MSESQAFSVFKNLQNHRQLVVRRQSIQRIQWRGARKLVDDQCPNTILVDTAVPQNVGVNQLLQAIAEGVEFLPGNGGDFAQLGNHHEIIGLSRLSKPALGERADVGQGFCDQKTISYRHTHLHRSWHLLRSFLLNELADLCLLDTAALTKYATGRIAALHCR